MGNKQVAALCITANRHFLGFAKYLHSTRLDFLPERYMQIPWKASLMRQGLWRLGFERRIREYCRKYDLLFCDWADMWAAKISQLVDEVPIVVRLHAFEIDRSDLLSEINWSNVRTLVTVSDYMKNLTMQSRHIACSRHVMIRNGIDLDRIPFRPSSTGMLCTYSLFDQPQKRVYDLMLALRNEVLHIGGKGTTARALTSAVKRFGLRHVLHGYAKIPDWLWDKEYFFMHSFDEGCPLSLLEAMASGLLCLSHDFEVSKEILPERYRYVYDDELLDLLTEFRALEDSERLQVKKEQRRIVETQYDVRDQAARFDSIFMEAAERKL
jgi:glycosyltransferase involved in cell wall biosynthesis